ncbi:MAG: MFS transporter [Gluconacetobacter diazotrophicus]|nr:MFS transporter [Gluconacetobacter diazotrophicus]
MLTVATGIVLAVLDGSIANVALPTIARDLRADPASSVWVVNAYQIAITVSLLPMASLGEIGGYRRVYRAGVALFALASLGCALAPSLTALASWRVLQGFGAAGIMGVNAALLRFIFPRAMLGRGIAINAMVVAVSSAVGPSVAAAVLSLGSWPWLFAINVPLGALALVGAFATLPDTPRGTHRFDAAGAALNAGFLGLLVFAAAGTGRMLGTGEATAILLVALGCGAVLVRRSLNQHAPLLPVDLLRIPVFALSICSSVASFAAQMLSYVFLPFFLEETLGRSAVRAGLLLTAWPLALAAVAPVAGRLADRRDAGLLGGVGMAVMAAGLLSLWALPPRPGDFDLAWRLAVCGIGFGLFQTPNNRTMLHAAPRNRAGGASGMLATARLVGQTLGAAAAAGLFALHGGRATHGSLLLAAAVAAVAAGLSLTRLGRATPVRG